MKNTLICLIAIALSAGGSILASSQVRPRDVTSSRKIVKVEPSSDKGEFLFVVGDERIHTRDILDFLNKHWDENSERTAPIVMIPPSLTVLEIGSIEAIFSKAGYHKVRFFLYAKNSNFVQELKINEPIPSDSISGPVRPKL